VRPLAQAGQRGAVAAQLRLDLRAGGATQGLHGDVGLLGDRPQLAGERGEVARVQRVIARTARVAGRVEDEHEHECDQRRDGPCRDAHAGDEVPVHASSARDSKDGWCGNGVSAGCPLRPFPAPWRW